ncbi:MAG: lipopolysaccharide biosynthesis protein [Sphingomonas sp.]|uniref:GumC family protein n=1 Tax=Sphingomonas sp. TaxID=28214 RepID=UPI001B09736A|nr:lipopolysaccharide biosynthesis protein [Sphingomonas sp.]MBO9623898.1 lipopolysaccharide biosynthesis protein [Sphingomonas sp.]
MNPDLENDGLVIDPREILAILFRRRYWLVLPAAAGLLIAAVFLKMQAPSFRSSATLLIDSQQIPTTLVASPLTNVANERIAKIRQQIVSRESLASIIREQALYAEEQKRMPIDDVLSIMRDAIHVDLVGATQADAGTGRTIAFTLSFAYRDPAVAQVVTRELTDRFLREDKRTRTEQAVGTATFLGRRADELMRQLTRLEGSKREIEAKYAGALPNQVALSTQSEAALRAEVSRIDSETQGLMQQNGMLAARERELSQAPRPGNEAVARAEERLAQLSAVYADDFPEVIAAREAVARHRAALRDPPSEGGSAIEREVAAGRSRIQMLAGRRAELIVAISELDRRASLAPQASYELATVDREYDNMKGQYEELREKQLEAQVAANLQTEDKGERFSVVDEPSFPYEALGPNPSAVLLTGLIGGACAAAFLVLVLEFLRGTIHGEAALARLMGSPPLGVVPALRAPPWPLNMLGRVWRSTGSSNHVG